MKSNVLTPGHVRRRALNLVYAVLANGNTPAEFDYDLFWEISCEKETDHFRTAHAKAVLHVARFSADSARLLAERAENLENTLHGDLTTAALREEAAHYAKQSAALDSSLAALQYTLNDKRRETTDQLALCTKDTLTLAKAVAGLGEELLIHLADAVVYRSVTEPLSAVVRRRGRLAAAVAALADPLTLGDEKDFASLHRQARELKEMRPAAEALAKAVMSHMPEMDAQLETLLAHYTTERLDLVDKAILYIALHELQVNKLEVAIVVSEATALAHAYSGSKSAPFIHGIIAAAAKA